MSLIGQERKRTGDSHDFTAHVANFVACAKAGTPDQLNAPISEGVKSTILCHLANIGTRVGRPLTLTADKKQFIGDDAANNLIARTYREGYELPNV